MNVSLHLLCHLVKNILPEAQIRRPLRKFKLQFKKSSFIIQEQGSRTGHELLLKCSRSAKIHFMNVKLDKYLRTIVLKNCSEQFKNVLFLNS